MDKEVFNDTLRGLEEAIAYAKGDTTKARSKTVVDSKQN